jgi:hypothetical protein
MLTLFIATASPPTRHGVTTHALVVWQAGRSQSGLRRRSRCWRRSGKVVKNPPETIENLLGVFPWLKEGSHCYTTLSIQLVVLIIIIVVAIVHEGF